ncbi:hypothetical protein [Aestuariispira insulae]|uniref:LysE type translocator n=1 Tax=Aestuariispira insulae TaxID=1461337 RepID=A0A3D9HPI6_9PROT|nr:hypothetical protein [Aestuariispira insulae]RED51424.1 hypothetical protein DFP90_103225 [Aestuariispira insulae]
MTLETWLAFLLAAGANVLTPGPAIALAIRNSDWAAPSIQQQAMLRPLAVSGLRFHSGLARSSTTIRRSWRGCAWSVAVI